MTDFFMQNQYNEQATEKDDLADEDHLSDTVGPNCKGNDLLNKTLLKSS